MTKSDWGLAWGMYALFLLNLNGMIVLARTQNSWGLFSLLAAGWAGTTLFKIDERREKLRAFRR